LFVKNDRGKKKKGGFNRGRRKKERSGAFAHGGGKGRRRKVDLSSAYERREGTERKNNLRFLPKEKRDASSFRNP